MLSSGDSLFGKACHIAMLLRGGGLFFSWVSVHLVGEAGIDFFDFEDSSSLSFAMEGMTCCSKIALVSSSVSKISAGRWFCKSTKLSTAIASWKSPSSLLIISVLTTKVSLMTVADGYKKYGHNNEWMNE